MTGRLTTSAVLEELRQRLAAGYSLLYLQTHEEHRWETLLAELLLESERGLVTWSLTQGLQPWLDDHPAPQSCPEMLSALWRYPPDHVFLLKDFHMVWNDPRVVRQLRELSGPLAERRQAIWMLGPTTDVPLELEKQVVRLLLPLPDYHDFRGALDELLSHPDYHAHTLSAEDQDRLIHAVLGLTLEEGVKAWRRVLQGTGQLTAAGLSVLIAEKRTLATASRWLQFHDLDAGVDDVGGLDELKLWLQRRALAYSPKAREQGIPLPRGVLLLGVQGCGKSLTARAVARLLSFPLIRLDISHLLSAQRGESERNLREVLQLVESIAPAVLWLDEMEKGFAGLEGDSFSDATMARLVGSFLMWMQEHQQPVFVVATANSVQNLPPEMLRRGRFDELFFIDLPNFAERLQILSIHLRKRGWKPERFHLEPLAEHTEGYSGAELEQVVSAAIIEAFGRGELLQDEHLDRARRHLVPLSKTMEDQIFALRQWAQDRCRRATSDNRVSQMLEAERRYTASEEAAPQAELPAWAALAQAGQVKAALVEFVHQQHDVLFPQLVTAFAPYAPTQGEFGLALRAHPQAVIWLGMSQELCEWLIDLISTRRLYLHPCDAARYPSLGSGWKWPTLTAPPDEKLTRPHWLPCSLRTSPHPQHTPRLLRLGRIKPVSSADTSSREPPPPALSSADKLPHSR
ncbi:MAG: hypothetical protein KatS3mg114_1460 [Planctomycetaceae bacterium]|nr:MAG: hypothetical protein KatS3mg114_1460 [Planctomycetaceae bacterium]